MAPGSPQGTYLLDPKVLREYVESSGLSLKRNSVSWIFDCPRCGKRDKLYLRMRDGRFVCWVCKETENFQGRPEFALAELLGVPLAVVKEALYGEAEHQGTVYLDPALEDFFGQGDIIDADADEVPAIRFPWDYYRIDDPKYAKRGADYLAGRGIPLEIARGYGLRYAPVRRRVVFPVTIEGRLVGYQERTVLKDTKVWSEEQGKYFETPKVLSSKGNPREQLVMFAERLKGYEHVVLCEGPIDAIKAHLCGANVAAMGKAVSKGQIALLRNNGIKKVYLALDPDAADETARLVREFADLDVYLMHPPGGRKDLGEMSMEEVRELFLSAGRVNPGRIFVFLDGQAAFV